MDIAEHAEAVEILEVIRIAEEIPDCALGCDHHSCECMKGSVFYCPSCGLMAETKPRDWGGLDCDGLEKYTACKPRLEKLLDTFFTKRIDPAFNRK